MTSIVLVETTSECMSICSFRGYRRHQTMQYLKKPKINFNRRKTDVHGSSLRKKMTKLFKLSINFGRACENRRFEIPDYVVERPWKKPRNVDNKKRTEHDQESLNK